MGTGGYGISLRVFNLISYEWAQRKIEISSWTGEGKFHIYKQPRFILFLYKHTNDDFFEYLPKISEHFPKISEDFPKVFRGPDNRFRTFSIIFRRFLRKNRWCLDHTVTHLGTFLRGYVTIVMVIFLVTMVTPRYNFLEKGKTLLFHSVPRNWFLLKVIWKSNEANI